MQDLINKEQRKAYTHAIMLGVQSPKIDFLGAAGEATPDSPYFIASITKMYTVAVLMRLVDEGLLDLDAPLTAYLPGGLLKGIHVYKGVDYSHQLKVYQLIHQTSGLPDYFEGDLLNDLKQNKDHAYTINDVLDVTRSMSPKFAPDSGQKSDYSDTNYQLLSTLIETLKGCSLAEVFESYFFDRLDLLNTYLFDHKRPVSGKEPLSIYHKDQRLTIPLMLSSELGAGGIVSTLPESLRFLQAYFDGELFDAAHFGRMLRWNSLFFPLQYGYGLMRFKLPRAMTLFRPTPEFIGHSGSTGAFAFYAPQEKLYIVGTFNQIDKPSRPFNFMLRVAANI